MAISGPDNTPKQTEFQILPKSNNSKEKDSISINSIIEDLKVTKEESKLLHINREYDLTKEEDIEAFHKDMKFDDFNINIRDMINDLKKRKEIMQQTAENNSFSLDYSNFEVQQKDNPDIKEVQKPRMSYGQALSLLNEHPVQMEMNMMKDGGSTSVTIDTTEGKMTISINRALGNKYNGCITVCYPDGEIQTISPNGFLVNPTEESKQENFE